MMLITGSLGKLGREVTKVFDTALTPGYMKLDITDEKSVFAFIGENKPDTIIHLAAKTSVKECEENKESAYRTNVLGTENLVNAVLKYNPDCYFVYMSTAGVFNCERGDYTENDIPDPKNYYCLTKLLGEFVVKRLKKHLIIRANFVVRGEWPYERAFTDRFGTYLFADDLARGIKDVVNKGMTSIVHVAGEKKISMFDLAKITTPNVQPMTMSETSLPLTRDMSLISIRIKPYKLTRQK